MKLKKILLSLIGLSFLYAIPSFAKQTINFWYENTSPEYKKILVDVVNKYYNSTQDKYEVKIQFHTDIRKDVKVALLSGTGPDVIFLMSPAEIAMLAKGNRLLPLDKYVSKYHWDERIIPYLLEPGKYKGKLYGLAKSIETLGVIYNTDTLKEKSLTLPTNFKELDAFVKASKDNNLMTLSVGNSGWKPANEWIVSSFLNNYAGVDNVYKALKGELSWNSPVFIEAMNKLNDYFQNKYLANGNTYFSLAGDQPIVLLKNKKASSVYVGSWGFQWVKQQFGDNYAKVKWTAFPTKESTGKTNVYPIGIGASLAVNKDSKSPDGAADFLNFMMSDTFYKIINEKWPGEWNIPLKNAPLTEVKGMYEPYRKSMLDLNNALSSGNFGFTTWSFFPPATRQAFIDDIEKVWLNKMSVKEMMSSIDKKFKKELKKDLVPNIPNPMK